MTTDLHINIRTAAGRAREAVEDLAPTERVTALAHALDLERASLAEERDSLRARLADLEAAMGKPKRTPATRSAANADAAKVLMDAASLRESALAALEQPRTVDEVARDVQMPRGQVAEALADLVTDGRAAKVRAGRGWRFQRATATAAEGLRLARHPPRWRQRWRAEMGPPASAHRRRFSREEIHHG